MKDESMQPPELSRTRGLVALAVVVAAHLALVAYFAPWPVLLSPAPVLNDAYGLQAYLASRAVLAGQAGALWAWDPHLLAGRAAGVGSGVGSQALVLLTALAAKVGLNPGMAFNAIILLVHVVLPGLGYAAARAYGSPRSAAVVVAASWSGLWFFDSLVHWSWHSGRIMWVAAAAALPFVLAAARRCSGGGLRRGAPVLALSLAVATLLHPVVLVVVAIALGVWLGRRRSGGGTALLIGAITFGVALGSVPLSFGPEGVGGAPLMREFRVSPGHALFDTFDLVTDGHGAHGIVRTMVRTTCWFAGAVGLWMWGSRDERVWPATSLVVAAVFLGYVGDALPVRWPIDPHLFLVPGVFVAAIPAGEFLSRVLSPSRVRSEPAMVRVALVVAALVILPRGFRTLASYVPEVLPERVARNVFDTHVSALVGLNEAVPSPRRHDPTPEAHLLTRDWLVANHGGRGRIWVVDPGLAALLAGTTSLQVLAPLAERDLPERDASMDRLGRGLSGAALAAFLERYAVGRVVLSGRPWALETRADLFDHVQFVGGFRVLATRAVPSYVARGRGRVVSTELDRIRVRHVEGSVLALKYHFQPTLRCRPGCTVERLDTADDRVGFISIASPPRELEIFNDRGP